MQGDSIQDRVRKARDNRIAGTTVQLPVPGYKGVLLATYRGIPWRERREIMLNAQSVNDQVDQELMNAADLLIASCVSMQADIDGEQHDLNVKMGISLAGYLSLEMEHVDTDRQALYLIIPDEGDVIEHCGELLMALRKGQAHADDEIVGESSAAS